MKKIKNVILIGSTGSGKSTLGNVLLNKNNNFEEVFKQSNKSVSKTREIQEEILEIELDIEGNEKEIYRIIDTIGLSDTKLTPQGVLIKLAGIAERVKKDGINQIFFVTNGRFDKTEVEAYDLLSSIIFDKDVINYTTIIRTNFEDFEDEEKCEEDRQELRQENAGLAHILKYVKINYVDNPRTDNVGRQAKLNATNKETREISRKRLLTYLGTCQDIYYPSNIEELDERVHSYTTNEQKLKDKMKELEKERKEQTEKFRKEMVELREKQAEELGKMKQKNEEDIHKVKTEGEENLKEKTSEIKEENKKDMDEMERRNKKRANEDEERHKRNLQRVEDNQEQQKRNFQDQLQQSKSEAESLRKKVEEKSSSSNAYVNVELAKLRTSEAENRKEELKIQAEANRREQDRLDKESAAKQKREDNEARLRNEQQALQLQKEKAGAPEKFIRGFTGWN